MLYSGLLTKLLIQPGLHDGRSYLGRKEDSTGQAVLEAGKSVLVSPLYYVQQTEGLEPHSHAPQYVDGSDHSGSAPVVKLICRPHTLALSSF